MKIAFISTMLLLLGLANLAQATPPSKKSSTATNTPVSANTPVPAKFLRSDPLLQATVTIDAVEVPIGDVLAGLKSSLKLDLTAEQDVSDQRVTLHVTGQPAYMLMQELLLLLSHNADHPCGYHWGSLERSAGERPSYQLWRDLSSVAQEQEERDAPRRQLAVMLHEMRRQAQLLPQMTTEYKRATPSLIPDPEDPYTIAFHSLTDTQLEALVDGETVPLDLSQFAAYIEASRLADIDEAVRQKAHRDELDRMIYSADLHAKPPMLVLPPAIEVPPPPAGIRIVPADKDNDENNPGQFGKYDLYLPGIMGDNGYRNLDATDILKDPEPEMVYLNLPKDVSPRVDLAPFLAAKTVTEQQRGNLGFTLQALAKAAHINLYGESFLRTSLQNRLPHPGLTVLHGSVPRLVAQICAVWDYHAEPVQGGYFFWSRTWAQDRALDVPERLITPWRQRLAKNGELNLYDRAEIDTALTWPQVALTLDPALPEAGKDDGVQTYRMLNLFGSLTPIEQAQALTPDGLPLPQISARGQAALAADYRIPLRDVPSDQFASAVLRFQAEDDVAQKLLRVTMSMGSSRHKLLSGICIMPLNVVPVGKSAK